MAGELAVFVGLSVDLAEVELHVSSLVNGTFRANGPPPKRTDGFRSVGGT